MNTNPNYHNFNQMQTDTTTVDGGYVASKTFMTQVFGWMSGALMITSLTAYLFGNVPQLIQLLYEQHGNHISMSPLGWIVTFAPFAFILLMGIGFNKLSFPVLLGAFLVFSAVMGMSLGYIFFFFRTGSIVATFIVTSGMFGVMAVMGWITKADLSRFGAILYMGLGGLVLAMVVNWFLGSQMLDYVISFAGVAIFTGLTAYDVQKLKNVGAEIQGDAIAAKVSIMGALTLYLRFINLFMFLLRLMGSRK